MKNINLYNEQVVVTMDNTHLTTTHIFVPIAVETINPWNVQAAEFVQDLEKQISEDTNDPLEKQYLL